jgi:hypothetical protein
MKISNKVLWSAVLLAAGGLAAGPAALAIGMSCTYSPEICIAVGTAGNVVAASTTGSAAVIGGTSGSFTYTITGGAFGAVAPPQILDSNTFNTATSKGGTLQVFVTATGLTSPTVAGLVSALDTNLLPSGWIIVGQSYFDSSNVAFGMGTQLFAGSVGTSFGSASDVTRIAATGPYSLTEVYTIAAGHSGTSNDTFDISTVPEPGTLALFGAGLLGCALLVGRRRRASQPRV